MLGRFLVGGFIWGLVIAAVAAAVIITFIGIPAAIAFGLLTAPVIAVMMLLGTVVALPFAS